MLLSSSSLLLVSLFVGICESDGSTNVYTVDFSPFFGKTLKGNYWFASQYCKSIGMQVITPDTPEKMEVVVEFMKKHNLGDVWTSGSDLATEGNFVWMLNSFALENASWHNGQPDDSNGVEDCVEVWNVDGLYRLNDRHCIGIPNCLRTCYYMLRSIAALVTKPS